MYTHRIIHVGAGTAPSELRFESEAAAKTWLEAYPVNANYKAENYRIVPISQTIESIPQRKYPSFCIGR